MSPLRTLLLFGTMVAAALTAQSNPTHADVNNIVLVHGANIDGTKWRGVYDSLSADGFKVSVIQLPLTSVEDDLAAL